MFDKSKKSQDSILKILIDHAPNGLRLESIQRRLPNLTQQEIDDAIRLLEAKMLVRRENITNSVTGKVKSFVALIDLSKYPIGVDTIRIGDQDFPRFMHGEMVGAEDMNELLESLAEYSRELESRFVQLSNEQTQKYWANTITLFGLFMAVFTLIIAVIPKIQIDNTWSFDQVLWLSIASVFPQFIVLMVFVIILRIMFRRQ